MLQIKNLRKAYGKYQALDGLSMEVKEGALYGFVGPNGAGKTTTIKILAGLLAADSGQVLLDGENALGRGRKLKGKIGYVPDEFGTYDNLKVREYMEFLPPATAWRGWWPGTGAACFWSRWGWRTGWIFTWTAFPGG